MLMDGGWGFNPESDDDYTVRFGQAAETKIGAVGPAGQSGILFGLAGAQSYLFRHLAFAIIETDAAFRSDLDIWARDGVATQTKVGAVGPAAEAGIVFGSANDVKLYRRGAGLLGTEAGDSFVSGGYLASTGNIYLDNNGSGSSTLFFSGTSVNPRIACTGANALQILANNTTDKLGFHGTAPIVQQTGVAVTAAGVHAALVNLGLITA